MLALSIKQPWAHAILHLGKDIENRDWQTSFRGTIAVHASKGMTKDEFTEYRMFVLNNFDRILSQKERDLTVLSLPFDAYKRGAIVGTVEIYGCVSIHASPWFSGRYGFVLGNPKVLEKPIPCKGALKFWEVPKDIEAQILEQI